MSYNQVYRTGVTSFGICFQAPPPPPINVSFSFDRKKMFQEHEVMLICEGFKNLMMREGNVFMKKTAEEMGGDFEIRITHNFHYDVGGNPEDLLYNTGKCEHINVILVPKIKNDVPYVTHHVYFTKDRKNIKKISRIQNDEYRF